MLFLLKVDANNTHHLLGRCVGFVIRFLDQICETETCHEKCEARWISKIILFLLQKSHLYILITRSNNYFFQRKKIP